MGLPVLSAALAKPASTLTYTFQASSGSGVSSLSPTIPAHVANDVLVVVAACGNRTLSASAGWTEKTETNGSNNSIAVYTRRASGSGTTITITPSSSTDVTAHVYVFSGAQGSVDADSAAGADAPNLTTSWGALSNYWIAAHAGNAAATVPAGFADKQSTSITFAELATATKNDEVASLNPAAWGGGVAAGAAAIAAIAPA